MQNPFQSFLLGLEVLPSLSKRSLYLEVFFIKSNKFPFIKVLWGLPINSWFIIETKRLPEIEILLNYEVNTGNPIVAVVIRAPAKIKKGRKG